MTQQSEFGQNIYSKSFDLLVLLFRLAGFGIESPTCSARGAILDSMIKPASLKSILPNSLYLLYKGENALFPFDTP